ncbi:MAG: choice-of-anchor L domain-containing protein [Myxococcales bacterium]|nr:choice-of-anchor L domain-containing protein [Myxococcales bacterium]
MRRLSVRCCLLALAFGLAGCGERSGDGFDGIGASPLDGGIPGTGFLDIDGTYRMACSGEWALAVDDDDAVNAALALGLCPFDPSDANAWGLVGARYTTPDGTGEPSSLAHGLLPGFGSSLTPRNGERLLALSSGTARRPIDPGYERPEGATLGTQGAPPEGFPVEFPSCDVKGEADGIAYDGAALEITLRPPPDAARVHVDVNFFTYEFPSFVCSRYNDFFVVLQSPSPDGAQMGNVAFDANGNPISVNNTFVQACKAQDAGGKHFSRPLGTTMLEGTGYENAAASGWLDVSSPVEPGSTFTLRFAVWDSGDMILDSTVLLDNLRFEPGPRQPPSLKPLL